MSAHGETRRISVAPVGEGIAFLVLNVLAVAGQAKRWLDAAGRAFERRQVMADLAALDDHMLRDIGITRADIRDAIGAPVGADPTLVLVLRATERRAALRLARREQGRD
ncbi:DUF1127 domain-containing protein [Xanthobacter sp. V4C-4]|uniref:DUF1127 domain-containing protein n=1 Tax=Xanthobacter cornucopiae TaxID=3119924 RepID=UPI00372BCC5B